MFTPIQKTQEEIVKDQLVSFYNHTRDTLENTKLNTKTSFDLIFNNPLVTPQEMVTGLGTSAKGYFLASIGTQNLIYSLDPTYIKLVCPYEYTLNEDGTVTLGDLIEDEEIGS